MAQIKYPFRLDAAFFAELLFKRMSQMPDPVEMSVEVQAKVVQKNFPERIEVHLKVETPDDSPLKLRVVVIGLFDLIEGEPAPEPDIIPDFLSDRAFYLLWSYVDQVVTQTTSKMGIDPVRLQAPIAFSFNPT